MRPRELIVGIDGSPESEQALAWAANEAARRGADLLVLHVFDWHVIGAPTPMGASFVTNARKDADDLVATAVAKARELVPGLAVRGEAVLGRPAPTLISASANGATVVVGNRGRGGFASLLLGSISQQVALHAHGPVVVVRGRPDPQQGPVVVGVDGSPDSQQALRIAFEQATARGTGVDTVRAYSQYGPASVPGVAAVVESPEERRASELAALAADVAPWAEKYPDVNIACTAIDGQPGEVLTARSEAAQLVVVGHRGHGGFTGLLLGAVGQQLLHHAHCPVLVARSFEG